MIVTLMTCEVHGRRGILTIRETPEVGMLHFEHHYDDGLKLCYRSEWPLNLVCAFGAELNEDDEEAWLCDRELSIWVWDWPDSDLEDEDYEEEEEDE